VNPPIEDMDAAIEARNANSTIKYLEFLYRSYKPTAW
jgi:hypothetical protein